MSFMFIIIIAVVASALIIGALWGSYFKLPAQLEGFLIALAGGALIVSLMQELIMPAMKETSLTIAFLSIWAGAIVFTVCDYWIDEKWGNNSGGGLLAAITLDGIPENLALGVALIGATPAQVAALAGSIFLSNLPEAAGGAKQMRTSGYSKTRIIGLWTATAVLLSLATVIGYTVMDMVSPHMLASVRCFAGGAVVASLATEVFPTAFKDDHHFTGIAVTCGLIAALLLGQLA